MRRPERAAGRVPAWRTRRRLLAGPSAVLRSQTLSNHRIRPAWGRPFHAARRNHGQRYAATWSTTSKNSGCTWRSIAGSCSADHGVPPWPCPMRRRIRTDARLFLRGIFLMQPEEIDWFLYGMRTCSPRLAAFRQFHSCGRARRSAGGLSRPPERPRPGHRTPAARSWSVYEGSCSTLLPNPEVLVDIGGRAHAVGLARIEAHYFHPQSARPARPAVAQYPRDPPIPAIIVQGDMTWCARSSPPMPYMRPGRRPNTSSFRCGHSALEPGIRTALIDATNRFADRADREARRRENNRSPCASRSRHDSSRPREK